VSSIYDAEREVRARWPHFRVSRAGMFNLGLDVMVGQRGHAPVVVGVHTSIYGAGWTAQCEIRFPGCNAEGRLLIEASSASAVAAVSAVLAHILSMQPLMPGIFASICAEDVGALKGGEQ
jgi:hypothetical protein